MSYRVVIPTAGIGSRLNNLTLNVNKSLVSVGNRPIISHIIEQFPKTCKFVIATGHKGELVKDFLELAYPDRNFYFVNVYPYKGVGSGLGYTLLSCESYLQEPFVFTSCDSLVKERIPNLDHNWMGFASSNNLSSYRTLEIIKNKIEKICEKRKDKSINDKAYIGLAGV